MTNPTPRDSAQLPESSEFACIDSIYQVVFTADQVREALRAQAASVEPVALQQAYRLGFCRCTEWAKRDDLIADIGSPAYLRDQARDLMQAEAVTAPPAHIPADVEAAGWCEYVAGMVGHWVRSDEYAGIKADEDRCTKAIAGIIERRLWALKPALQPQAVAARSPATAVDAWRLERQRHIANEWADMATSALQWLRNIVDGISTPAEALENTEQMLKHCRKVNDAKGLYGQDKPPALQASRQPQAQQAVAPSKFGSPELQHRIVQRAMAGAANTARDFIEWCKAQPEDRVPVSIDEALNEFEAHIATKEQRS